MKEKLNEFARCDVSARNRSAWIFQTSAAVVLFLVIAQLGALGQASLATENIVDEIAVSTKTPAGADTTQKWTVLRDARVTEQWYYVPSAPRIVTTIVDGHLEPEFTLIRYDYRDPANNQVFKGGGILQFAVTMSAPDEAIPQLKAAIIADLKKRQLPLPASINLAALPLKSAQVAVYSPKGTLLGEAPLGTGVAPTFATQKMIFSIPLTELGSDVYDALVTAGNTGVPVAVTFKFNGLTPPAGFRVDVDWNQAFHHYSTQDKFRAQASYFGLWGGSVSIDRSYIREQLEKNKVMKISVIEGENFTSSQIDAYLQPIVKRINDEILEDMKPPDKIDPAVAPEPSMSGGWFGSAGYSVAVKDVSVVKKGTETIDFRYSKIQERETVASGFIGIGEFGDDIRKKLITVVDSSKWQRSYFPLPPVSNALSQANLEVSLVKGDKVFDTELFIWKPSTGWMFQNAAVSMAGFSLSKVLDQYGDAGLREAEYDVKQTIVIDENQFTSSQKFKVFDKDAAIGTPVSLFDLIVIDPRGMRWREVDSKSPLRRVVVKLTAADQSFQHTFLARNVNGTWQDPEPIHWAVRRSSNVPVIPEITYIKGAGESISSPMNGKNLRASPTGLDIYLEDIKEDDLYPAK